jgi:hypothetical protein
MRTAGRAAALIAGATTVMGSGGPLGLEGALADEPREIISGEPLRYWPGDPGTIQAEAVLGGGSGGVSGDDAVAPLSGATTQASLDCSGAPPQQYQMFPRRGCSFAPPNPTWANEGCFGRTGGAYYCREIAGHPQLNVAPRSDWLVYKSDVRYYSKFLPAYGMQLVHSSGHPLEGCFDWMKYRGDDGRTDYVTVCDYKLNKDHAGPRRFGSGSGWDYAYNVLRHWAHKTYENQFSCAVTIAGTWTGATDTNDMLPACQGVFW